MLHTWHLNMYVYVHSQIYRYTHTFLLTHLLYILYVNMSIVLAIIVWPNLANWSVKNGRLYNVSIVLFISVPLFKISRRCAIATGAPDKIAFNGPLEKPFTYPPTRRSTPLYRNVCSCRVPKNKVKNRHMIEYDITIVPVNLPVAHLHSTPVGTYDHESREHGMWLTLY